METFDYKGIKEYLIQSGYKVTHEMVIDEDYCDILTKKGKTVILATIDKGTKYMTYSEKKICDEMLGEDSLKDFLSRKKEGAYHILDGELLHTDLYWKKKWKKDIEKRKKLYETSPED